MIADQDRGRQAVGDVGACNRELSVRISARQAGGRYGHVGDGPRRPICAQAAVVTRTARQRPAAR